jgi:hypothetical protein
LRLKVKGERLKEGRMMNYLKMTLITTACFLFLGAGSGQALISPDHYERIVKERQKAKENEKKDSQTKDKSQRPGVKKAQPPVSPAGH